MKELCAAILKELGSDFYSTLDMEEFTDDKECNCENGRGAKRRRLMNKIWDMGDSRSTKKSVNMGWKHLFEDSDESLKKKGECSCGQRVSDIKEEDYEILANLLNIDIDQDMGKESHCFSIQELEEMLQKEAEKYSALDDKEREWVTINDHPTDLPQVTNEVTDIVKEDGEIKGEG